MPDANPLEKFVIARTRSPARETRALPGISASAAVILIAVAATSFAEIRPSDCARAAMYSESRRGVSLLVMQNGRTIFEHYANGGSARGRWPIFGGRNSVRGIAARSGAPDGLFWLDDL